jgi:hypothetical protein
LKLSCYVYYRILPEQLAEARAAACKMIEAMHTLSGVEGRLLTKVDEPLLWMEVYEGFGNQAEFLSMLQESVEQSGLLARLADDGKRHIEVFQCA